MNGTNLGDIQHGLAYGKGVFAGQNGEAYFLQPDGSVIDLRGQIIRQASAAGKAIYDAHDPHNVPALTAITVAATTVEAGTIDATTVNATTVDAGTVEADMVDTAAVEADTVDAEAVETKDLSVAGNFVMYEGPQKYYVTITGGTLAATAAYLIDLTADEHVTIEIKDADDAEYVDGSEVLNGKELTVTLTFDEGYEADTFTVNTVDKTSPAAHTVNAANVVIAVTSKAIPTYKIDLAADEHVTVEIKDAADVVYEDDDDVYDGKELTITLTFESGYEVDAFTVNTTPKVSPATHTVNGENVVIAVTSKTT